MDERAPLVASRSRWGLAKVRCVMSPLAAVALVNTGALCAVGAGYHMLGHQGVSTTTVLAEEAPAGGAHDVGARFDTTGFWQGKASPVAAAAADAVPSVYVAAADGWSTDSDEALRGARVLVTGAAGFIGSHVVQALIDPGAFDSDWPATDPSRVVAVDDFNQYYSSELKRTRAANHDGTPQSQRGTTPEEFLAKLEASGVALPTGEPIITHCGSGGRGAHRRGSRVLPRASQLPSRCVGGKAAGILRDLGYDAYNGGSPANIAAARKGE